MKPAAVRPAAEDPNGTGATADGGDTATKRSGRIPKKRVLVAGGQGDGNAGKRRRRTRSSSAIAPVLGASLLAGAVEKKSRKATGKRGPTGNQTGKGAEALSEAVAAAVTSCDANGSSSSPKPRGSRKRTNISGTTAHADHDDGGGGDGSHGRGDGDVAPRGRPKTNGKAKPVADVTGPRDEETHGGRAAVAPDETDDWSAGPTDVLSAPEAAAAADSDQFERDVLALSKRFGLPVDALAGAIERDAMPVFRERFDGSVGRAMIAVSPAAFTRPLPGAGTPAKAGRPRGIRYTVQPARWSAGCGAATLKRLMDELTRTAPSWSLSVVAGPSPRYVIARAAVDACGAPIVDRSVVLDRQFRASVYVDGCLQYKYGKRYGTATEIVNLINELNAIATAPADGTATQ